MKDKKLRTRLLSIALSMAMLFSTMPTTVFAAESNTALGISGVNECHKEHDTACGYKEAVEGADCSHKNEDGTYSCVSDTVSDNTATPGDADKSACTHEDDCGYVEAVEGADCKHSCDKCDVKDSGEVNKQPAQEQCSCDILCIEGIINADCTFCTAEGAALTDCKGKATAEKSAYDKVVELFTALPNASVITEETTEEEKDSIFAQLTAAMDAFDALIADEQDLFMKEHLELYKAAMALNDAITGASPAPLATHGAGTTVEAKNLRIGDLVEVGAKINCNLTGVGNGTGRSYFDPYGKPTTGNLVTLTPGGVLNMEATMAGATTRGIWKVTGTNVVGIASNIMLSLEFIAFDPPISNPTTVTINTATLTGATATFEIQLTSGTKAPATGSSFTIDKTDKINITIKPSNGYTFKTAPTVASTVTSSVGTPAKQGDGSYTCQLSGFTGNSTITIAGNAQPPKTDVTISGLSKADGIYNGVAQVGYIGTANCTPSCSGSLDYTYYSGSTATGSPLSGAPTNAGTYTVVRQFPAAILLTWAHMPLLHLPLRRNPLLPALLQAA